MRSWLFLSILFAGYAAVLLIGRTPDDARSAIVAYICLAVAVPCGLRFYALFERDIDTPRRMPSGYRRGGRT